MTFARVYKIPLRTLEDWLEDWLEDAGQKAEKGSSDLDSFLFATKAGKYFPKL